MMIMKLALILILALPSSMLASARSLPVDGVSPAARTTTRALRRKANRRAQKTRPHRREQRSGVDGNDSNKLAPAPSRVIEIDAEGLRKLLLRGEGGAARPLLLNFWATWCVPCRKEFPDLVKIDADYRGRGLEFVLVSADDVSEIKTSVPKFLRQMRAASMPAYLLNASDTEAAIAQVDPAWGGELPATFLFDRQGKLAYRHFGIIKPAELREAIDKVVE